MSKKQKAMLIAVVAIALLVGIMIGLGIGMYDKEGAEDNNNETTMYKSICVICVGYIDADKASISVSDLLSFSLPETVLDFENIYFAVAQVYPGAKYELTLEREDGSALFKLIASSENKENLKEICDMAVGLLCEEIESTMENVSCVRVDQATQPSLS